jgi:Nucleotidyl transferase AbiEii toxin, Type IV TA system
MDRQTEPSLELARRVLPAPLLRALQHIFAQRLSATVLVGGSALAGFYAGHRRSDDLDLFSQTPPAQRAAVLATRSLEQLGATLFDAYETEQYFHLSCALEQHRFTVDAVLDPGLFEGEVVGVELAGGVRVASLRTLLRTKAATLVSRCSEKDLYDLIWLLERCELDIGALMALGASVDGGVDAEAVLISLTSATLSEQACAFGVTEAQTPRVIFDEVTAFRRALEEDLIALLEGLPVPPLGKAVRRMRQLASGKKRRSPL